MSAVKGEGRGGRRLVRFFESGRAEQTPSAIWAEGRWRDVEMISESLVLGHGGGPGPRRVFVVRDRRSRQYRLEAQKGGAWRVESLNGD